MNSWHAAIMSECNRLDAILELPIAERLRLVEKIWDSIVESSELLPVPESHRQELDRRLKLHRENPNAAISWETLRSRLTRSE